MSDPQGALGQALSTLLRTQPLLAHLLATLQRVPSAQGTLALQGPRLLFNPQWLHALPRAQRAGALQHEALHLLLGHPFRARTSPSHDIACDLVVNQLVGGRGVSLPEGSWTVQGLGLPPHRSAQWYAAELDRSPPPPQARPAPGSHAHWPTQASQRQRGQAALDRTLAAVWPRMRGAERDGVQGALREQVERALKAQAPSLSWRRLLALFASSARSSHRVSTYARQSRRYGEESWLPLPEHPSPPVPGLRLRRQSSLVVALDTSGSLSAADLERFFGELQGIWRQGARITLLECDDRVRRVSRYEGVPPESVLGGGGTDFAPVFAWVAEQPSPPDGLIYLTDGLAAPVPRPLYPLLWVMSRPGYPRWVEAAGAVVVMD